MAPLVYIVTLLILTLFWPRGDSLLHGLTSLASSRTRRPPSKQHQSSLICRQKKLTSCHFCHPPQRTISKVSGLSLTTSHTANSHSYSHSKEDSSGWSTKPKPLSYVFSYLFIVLNHNMSGCYYIDLRKIIKSLFTHRHRYHPSSSSSSPSSFSSSSAPPPSSFSSSPSDTAL